VFGRVVLSLIRALVVSRTLLIPARLSIIRIVAIRVLPGVTRIVVFIIEVGKRLPRSRLRRASRLLSTTGRAAIGISPAKILRDRRALHLWRLEALMVILVFRCISRFGRAVVITRLFEIIIFVRIVTIIPALGARISRARRAVAVRRASDNGRCLRTRGRSLRIVEFGKRVVLADQAGELRKRVFRTAGETSLRAGARLR